VLIFWVKSSGSQTFLVATHLAKIWRKIFDSLKREILTVRKREFWQFEKGNFDSLEKEISDSLKREILTVLNGKFWQFEKGNFDSFEKEISDSLKREIFTVWKGKFLQFGKGNFDSFKREIFTNWKGQFWQFGKGKFFIVWKRNFDSLKSQILRNSGITGKFSRFLSIWGIGGATSYSIIFHNFRQQNPTKNPRQSNRINHDWPAEKFIKIIIGLVSWPAQKIL
jgi:hypothetical protein